MDARSPTAEVVIPRLACALDSQKGFPCLYSSKGSPRSQSTFTLPVFFGCCGDSSVHTWAADINLRDAAFGNVAGNLACPPLFGEHLPPFAATLLVLLCDECFLGGACAWRGGNAATHFFH